MTLSSPAFTREPSAANASLACCPQCVCNTLYERPEHCTAWPLYKLYDHLTSREESQEMTALPCLSLRCMNRLSLGAAFCTIYLTRPRVCTPRHTLSSYTGWLWPTEDAADLNSYDGSTILCFPAPRVASSVSIAAIHQFTLNPQFRSLQAPAMK
jgi:hypothetical protein